MKKHRLFISSKKDLKALNKKIAIDSLFSVGETITNSPLVIGTIYQLAKYKAI